MVIAAASLAVAASATQPALVRRVDSIDARGYTRLIDSLKGKAVVVNMWATWCGPCRDEFPELVRFDREMAQRGVAFVSISMDMESARDTQVVPFLVKQHASFRTYIKAPRGDEEFINAIDPDWTGALPATFIYDTSGHLVKSIIGPTTRAALKRAVAPLLGGASAP